MFSIFIICIFIFCSLDSAGECDSKSLNHSAPSPSPLTQTDQTQVSQQQQQQHKDDSFLPSPLCSSLLLEMPPSPAVIHPSQVIPTPPPPPICSSPLSSNGKSRKRRAPTPFDAAEWLETLTCGLRPLTPPTAPFVEPDFSLDSDLNVNRVLDLMIEQWWRPVFWMCAVFSAGHEWSEVYASHEGTKLWLLASIYPLMMSESLAPRNVESQIRGSHQIKHTFDGLSTA